MKKPDSWTKKIHKLEFWAREAFSPLFWLTDPKREMYRCLVLYRARRWHFYYVNGSEQEAEKAGKKFFSVSKNQDGYLREADNMLERAAAFYRGTAKNNLEGLSDTRLLALFSRVRKLLNDFIAVYSRSEAAATGTVKMPEEKLEEIARARLNLRRAGEQLFYVAIARVLREAARRNSMSLNSELLWYALAEINELIKKHEKLPKKEIESRKRGLAVFKDGKKPFLAVGAIVDDLWRLTLSSSAEISGMVAVRGKVRGRVRVLLQTRAKTGRSYRIEKGEILVTDMTKPDMIMACRKAGAIVTDEGGIVCHAAIISRELKVPCIVGTKIATQVLKNGDLVEVDAEKGVVRIIMDKV